MHVLIAMPSARSMPWRIPSARGPEYKTPQERLARISKFTSNILRAHVATRKFSLVYNNNNNITRTRYSDIINFFAVS